MFVLFNSNLIEGSGFLKVVSTELLLNFIFFSKQHFTSNEHSIAVVIKQMSEYE